MEGEALEFTRDEQRVGRRFDREACLAACAAQRTQMLVMGAGSAGAGI